MSLVHPADGNPLRLCAQSLDGFTQLVVGGIHVVIDDDQIKVVLVVAFDFAAFFQSVAEVSLLKTESRQLLAED